MTDDAELRDTLAGADSLVVIDWTATWCGPCKTMAPVFAQLSDEHPDVVFLKVDVDELPASASEANVKAMPTFHFLRHNKLVAELAGAYPDKLVEMVAANK